MIVMRVIQREKDSVERVRGALLKNGCKKSKRGVFFSSRTQGEGKEYAAQTRGNNSKDGAGTGSARVREGWFRSFRGVRSLGGEGRSARV